METDPIFVTGNARSGTTFVQWFLSSHPRIHIHGQEAVSWPNILNFYNHLVKGATEAIRWNEMTKYPVPHFSGSSTARTKMLFRRFIHDYFTGMIVSSEIRWGLKHLWIFSNKNAIKQIEDLFPACKWVICVRNPFKAYNSQKNTFKKDQDLDQFLQSWVNTITNAKDKGNVRIVQIDKMTELTFAERKNIMNDLLLWLGFIPNNDTTKFIEEWPRVHKADFVRKGEEFNLAPEIIAEKIEKYHDLRTFIDEMQYAV